ncbi:MAG TPA: ArsR family transcriptional regulator [Acidimicrobiia bacterium]|nr:ArsR family transcriptional regulator [Acidimicrobiia bacterium]
MNRQERVAIHAALGDEHRLQIAEALAITDLTVGEIRVLTNMPSNLLAHHLDVLEEAGVIERRTSEGDRRRRYVVLTPVAGPFVEAAMPVAIGTPLFVCTANSARSQFAAALWNHRTGSASLSAGTEPSDTVNASAVRIASDFGLDLSGAVPHGYRDVATAPAVIISVCDRAGESPIPFEAPHLHWSVPDPVASGTDDSFRSAFRDIEHRIDRLLELAVSRDTETHDNRSPTR